MQLSKNKKSWLILVVLILVFLVISYLLLSRTQPKEYPSYVSHSPSPTGVKAFYTYLEDKNDSVKRWSHSPQLLNSEEGHKLLIMIEPTFIPESSQMKEYIEFMKNGNTIVLLKGNPHGMFNIKTYPVEMDIPLDQEYITIENQAGTFYKAQRNLDLRLQQEDGDKAVLTDEYGSIAVKRAFGSGSLIVSSTPGWITNESILDYDHIELILSLIKVEGNQSILFDEFVHGGKNGSTFLTIYPTWFLILLLQTGVFIFLWLWMKGKRFGPILVSREEYVRFSDEGIRALSSWYIRGRMYSKSLKNQAEYVKVLLQEKWGIPSSKEWEDLIDVFEKRTKYINRNDIESLLKGLMMILTKEKLTKKEFLHWSKIVDQLRKELEAENEQRISKTN
ncbi:DUF4350 domain-containing protein [Litchfieldia alkalitelluris]|uniref:DUF4350 domain-containing protein n=1 Tax=Litchfieldia alkalitelluris TaxID=304268 RepID=UPI000996517A|nr:DUF4350 domain-containing protein [Litchfieldia alkalitelluris]